MAIDTMEDILSVTADPHPVRADVGQRWVQCSPNEEYILLNITDIAPGEILVFLFTEDKSLASNCTETSLAYATLCVYEDHSNAPLVGFINVCPQTSNPYVPHNTGDRTRQLQYNYRIFLHEILHILGFISPIMDLTVHRTINTDWVAVTSIPVIQWGRNHYNCSYLMGAPVIGNHWDPFFVGEQEIMTACIPEDAILTPATLAFLDGVGPYKVLSDRLGRHDVIRQTSNGVGQGCVFVKIDKCGDNLADGLSPMDCARKCVYPGETVIVPYINLLFRDQDSGSEQILADVSAPYSCSSRY